MLCDELAKLNPPSGLEEMSKCAQFEYKAPQSPLSSTIVELSSSAGMPGTSGGAGNVTVGSSSSSSSVQQNSVPVYVEMEKLMSELD